MKRWFAALALLAFLALAAPLRADDAIQATAKYSDNFPMRLVFQLAAHARAKITKIALVVQVDGQDASNRFIPEFTPDTQVDATYEWLIARSYLPPGVTGKFWWTIEDEVGDATQTAQQSFRVEDAAHVWKKLAGDKLILYWYSGDDNFGKGLFERGVEAMRFLEKDTGVAVDRPVQVWIYGDRSDFFRALGPGAREWTGGIARPEFGVILINIEANALEWGKGATAHELAHIVVHEKIRSPLGDFSMPQWMDEGLAVYYETFPDKLQTQFSAPLRRAVESDKLISLRSISGNFPSNSVDANLAYGEGFSVVDFIYRKYGREKMSQLLLAFKAGGNYDDIFRMILGVDTDGLENVWRADVGAKPFVVAPRTLLTPVVIPTFSLSTDPVRAPIAPTTPLPQICGGAFGIFALGLMLTLVWSRR